MGVANYLLSGGPSSKQPCSFNEGLVISPSENFDVSGGGHEEVLRAAAWGELRSLRELLKMENLQMLEDGEMLKVKMPD